MDKSKRTCFVIQGFGKKTDFRTGRTLDLDASYEVIKEAVENAGLTCIRADEIQHSQVIDKPMYEHILNADLVIADLSTSNVNAVYELGVRHALCRRTTIIIAEDKWDFPFDINRSAIRTYEHLGSDLGRKEANRFSKALTEAITEILAKENEVDSPLYTYLPQLEPPALQASFGDADEVTVLRAAAHMPDSEPPADDGPSVKAITDQAKAAEKENDFEKAKLLYQAAHQIRSTDESVLHRLALATYKSKKPTEVEALWEAHNLIRDHLAPEYSNDPETIGLWAAVHKRLWPHTRDILHLEASIDALERGFKIQNDYYNGINLAYMLNVRAAREGYPPAEAVADYVLANRVRLQVIGICKEMIAQDMEDPEQKYWVLASLWEAHVGVGDMAMAGQSEKDAIQHVESSHLPGWMLTSTRDQIEKLKNLLERSPIDRISG